MQTRLSLKLPSRAGQCKCFPCYHPDTAPTPNPLKRRKKNYEPEPFQDPPLRFWRSALAMGSGKSANLKLDPAIPKPPMQAAGPNSNKLSRPELRFMAMSAIKLGSMNGTFKGGYRGSIRIHRI